MRGWESKTERMREKHIVRGIKKNFDKKKTKDLRTTPSNEQIPEEKNIPFHSSRQRRNIFTHCNVCNDNDYRVRIKFLCAYLVIFDVIETPFSKMSEIIN